MKSRKPELGKSGHPTVSIVIPAFNSQRWLGDAIESVLSQTYQDFEIIVVDDGSTDGTRLLVERFSENGVRYLYQENRGLSGARNTGVRAASGQYIGLLDADDLFKSNKLARQLAYLEKDPKLGAVTCGFDLIDEQGQWLRDESASFSTPVLDLHTLLFWNPLPSTLLIHRVWFERVGLFDESLARYEDWEFSIRLAQAGCRIGWIPEVLLSYRRHAANMSTAAHLVTVATDAALLFMTRLFQRTDLPEEIRELEDKAFGNLYLDAAARAYGAGLGEQARAWLETAVTRDLNLTHGDPPGWVTALSGYALGTLVDDPSGYMASVAAHLPERPEFSYWNERRLEAALSAARAFRMHELCQRTDARRSALRALALDPSLLANRGVVALGIRPW